MEKNTDFVRGNLESSKFSHLRPSYYEGVNAIKEMEYSTEDFMNYFPCFVGHLTLARYLSLFEIYKKTLGIAGHIAEVGIYKGAASIMFAKLTMLYESTTLTQVHGFDWFKGAANLSAEDKDTILEGSYYEPKGRVEALLKAQNLEHIVKLHDMDMTSKSVKQFFEHNQHLMFKIVMFDIGIYDVVKNCLPLFWERLIVGGIIIFDQFNFDIAPGETRAIRELLPNAVIRTFPHGWMPNAYIIKEAS